MKKTIHRADERGHVKHGGWLESNHSFSFGEWYDPHKMGFGTLRVINDDSIAPSSGFGMHPHKDMEIITIPLQGAVYHEDSLGNSGEIKVGEVQSMSAGTGIVHSEYNANDLEELTLFQIWIETRERGITPHYDQKSYAENLKKNELLLLASPEGKDSAVRIFQDAFISLLHLDSELEYKKYREENLVYVLVVEGEVELVGEVLNRRDALGLEDVDSLTLLPKKESQVLIFEIPK
jgi:hypothetical protein